MADMTGWSKYAVLPVTGSSDGAQTNYPIEITIPYQPFMNSDFSDIRFCLSDNTVLDYNRVSYTSSSTATFHVLLPSILPSPNITTVYVYAGNPNATDSSNPDAVYLFNDPCDSLANWTSDTVDSVTMLPSVSNGNFVFQNGCGTQLNKAMSLNGQATVEIRYKHSSAYRNRLYLTDATGTKIPSFDYGIFNPSIFWNGFTGITLQANTWYIIQFIVTATSLTWNILSDDKTTTILTKTQTGLSIPSYSLRLAATESASSQFTIDWIKIRKSTSNPPTVGSLGTWQNIITVVSVPTLEAVLEAQKPQVLIDGAMTVNPPSLQTTLEAPTPRPVAPITTPALEAALEALTPLVAFLLQVKAGILYNPDSINQLREDGIPVEISFNITIGGEKYE